MKTDEILRKLKSDVIDNNIATQKEIDRINHNQITKNKYLYKLQEKIPSITSTLQEQGFEIESIYPSKTGMSDDWKDGDYLSIALTLRPVSGKVRFILFDGYTKSGAGRNQKRLQAKADKLSLIMTEATSLSCSVNQYSFEIQNKLETNKSVLMTLWIK